MATTDDNDTTDTESVPEYDPDRFVRASELRRKERYCPHCRDLHAAFVFRRFEDSETCDGRPRARYECYECGCIRHFGVLVK